MTRPKFAHTSFLRFSLLILSFFVLAHCGSTSSNNPNSLGSIPPHWAKYLSQGSLGASLDVFDGSGELITHQELSVDTDAGTISSPEFKLPIGNTYRFVVVFKYGQGTLDPIPFAYADFTWLVDDFSEVIQFNENDIRYEQNNQDANISADLSDGKIPDLDLDRDGWSNWEELRDKVDPRDPNSIPVLPNIQILSEQENNSNNAIITLVGKDNAHVEEIRLLDPACGTTILSDSMTNNVDGSVTRTLVVKLDLLSVRNNPRQLQAIVGDGVTPSQTSSSSLNFNWIGTGSQPYFAFTEPQENSEVEGPTQFKGVACSREDIDQSSIKFSNQELTQYHWSLSLNQQRGDYNATSDSVDTTLLPDGVIPLKVTLEDALNRLGQGVASYKIINDSGIKIVSPVGRRWVFGNDQIAVSVKNVSDSNLVVVEGSGNFSLISSTAGGAVGTLHVGNLPEETVIPLTFKAVRSDGSEIVRKVDFTVKNKPQIEVLGAKASEVFTGWSTYLDYQVLNVDPNQLTIDNQSTADKGTRDCHEDAQIPGVMRCQGSFPVKVTSSNPFSLAATRLPTDPTDTCANCFNQAFFNITSNGLGNDLPEINVAIGAEDDEPEAPELVKMPSDEPTHSYRLSLKNLREGTVDFNQELGSGATFNLGELKPRTDFEADLKVLSGPGGNVIGEMFKEVTTGDLGLVGWWRFDHNNSIQDFSGSDLKIDLLEGVMPQLGGISLDGIDDYSSINDGLLLNPPNITVETIFKPTGKIGEQHLIDKRCCGNASAYDLRIQGTNYPLNAVWLIKRKDSTEASIIKDSIINENQFHSLTGTFNESLNELRLFFDGQEVGEAIASPVVDRSVLISGPTLIGRVNWIPDFNFQGIIQEVAIYNTVICSHDIWEHCSDNQEIDCGPEPAACF